MKSLRGSTITLFIDLLDGNFILLWVGDSPALLYTPDQGSAYHGNIVWIGMVKFLP